MSLLRKLVWTISATLLFFYWILHKTWFGCCNKHRLLKFGIPFSLGRSRQRLNPTEVSLHSQILTTKASNTNNATGREVIIVYLDGHRKHTNGNNVSTMTKAPWLILYKQHLSNNRFNDVYIISIIFVPAITLVTFKPLI